MQRAYIASGAKKKVGTMRPLAGSSPLFNGLSDAQNPGALFIPPGSDAKAGLAKSPRGISYWNADTPRK
jgi:hypothetical protein